MNLIDEMIAGLECELEVVKRDEEAAYEEYKRLEEPARIARNAWSPIYARRKQLTEKLTALLELKKGIMQNERTA